MYAINVVRFLNKFNAAKVKNVVSSLRWIQRNYTAKQAVSLDFKSQLRGDVVVFRLEQPTRFFFLFSISVVSCACWTYLAVILFRFLNNNSLKLEKNYQKTWGKFAEYSTLLSTSVAVFGWALLAGSTFYAMRSIRRIIVHKDGRFVSLETYGLPGYNTIKLPLNNLSSQIYRKKAKKFIPVKIKDRYFYYLIDLEGEFLDPDLFDNTVGVKRGFGK